MEKNNLWVLLGKQLSGEITEKERNELQQLIHENEDDLSYLVEFLEGYWKKRFPVKKGEEEVAFNEKWDKLSARILNENISGNAGEDDQTGYRELKRYKRSFWYKAAAVLLILVGISRYYLYRHSPPHAKLQEYVITAGGGVKKHIVMPDGTGIWLNADSRLSYNNEFAYKNREVWLEGEALFEVKKDAEIPFTVQAQGITVSVLGTEFNIQAYKNEPDVQTTLISGKVQVSLNKDPGKKIILSPREKLTVMREENTMENSSADSTGREKSKRLPLIPEANELKYQVQTLPVNPADSNFFTETAWVDNKLAFVYEPFSEVTKKMERRYGVHILFKDDGLKKVVMSGVFDKETVNQALQVLQMITHFNYQAKGDSIYLYK